MSDWRKILWSQPVTSTIEGPEQYYKVLKERILQTGLYNNVPRRRFNKMFYNFLQNENESCVETSYDYDDLIGMVIGGIDRFISDEVDNFKQYIEDSEDNGE